MITTAEALSGTWAANVQGWLWTAIPFSLVAVAQELGTRFPDPGWVLQSVILQWLASSLWSILVATISRRLRGRVVLGASLLMWSGFGVARGIVGGVVAAAAGLDPEWVYRVVFWTVVALIWMPLLTYAFAQWSEHRRLLAVRAELGRALEAASGRAAESAEARSRRIAEAVEDALGPTLDEIRAGLRENAAIDERAASAIVERLDELTARTADFSAAAVPPAPRPDGRISVAAASLDFELRRPVFAAILAAVATSPLVLPGAFRAGGWQHLAETGVAIAVATTVLVGAFAVLRAARIPLRMRSLLSRVGVVAAGLVGDIVLAVSPLHPFSSVDLVLMIVFPLVFAAAASTIATAVAYGTTNSRLDASARRDESALATVVERARAADEEVGTRLETLVRGELNGLLAGSAMALSFLATGAVTAQRREEVVAVVLERLDAAAAELRTW